MLNILLDEDIDVRRVCCERPMQIAESSTFVVDLNLLKHPDDVKKDEFGKWCYSGSHVVYYNTWKLKYGELEFKKVSAHNAENTVKLRRVHCKHPSYPHFQRLLAFVTGEKFIK